MAKRKGPKAKPLSEHRRNRLSIQLTDAELEALRELAQDGSPALYARDVVVRHIGRRRRQSG